MRGFAVIAVLMVGCGGGEPSAAPNTSTEPSTTTTASPATPPSAPSPSEGNAADCERVRACAVAFAAVAPAELAASAQVAAEQLDRSLVDSPARAAACTAALASFRADLERLELDVPADCASSATD